MKAGAQGGWGEEGARAHWEKEKQEWSRLQARERASASESHKVSCGFAVSGLGSGVSGLGIGVWDLGFGISCSGFCISSCGFRCQSLGFRV